MKGQTLKNALNTYSQELARPIAVQLPGNREDVIDLGTGLCSDRLKLALGTLQLADDEVKTYLPKRGDR